jgi:hypothetical protein
VEAAICDCYPGGPRGVRCKESGLLLEPILIGFKVARLPPGSNAFANCAPFARKN